MRKETKHLLIAFLVGIALYFILPTDSGLTAKGVKMIAVFVPTVYLWLACGTGWPSLLSVTMIALLGVTGGSSVYSSFWGNSCVVMVIPFYMVAGVLEESGAMEWIVKWILSRKVIAGKPALFRILYCFAIVLITCFCGAQVSCLIMFRILRQITYSIGYDEHSEFYKAHGLLTTWVTQSMDGVRPWGRPYTLTLLGLLIGFGYSNATIFTTLWIGIPFGICIVITSCLLVRFWMKPDVAKFVNYNPVDMQKELSDNPLTGRGKVSLAGTIVILFAWLLASCSFLGGIATYLTSISLAASVCLVAALMCVITVDGKPVMNLGQAMSKVPWNVIIFLGAIMFYANNFGSDDYGISLFLQNMLSPIVSGLPTWLVIVIGVALASIITNFCSDTVAGIVVIGAFVPAMQATAGISDGLALAFGLSCISICSAAFCTVSAAPAMGICFSETGIEYKGTAKYSAVCCIIQCVVMCVAIIPFASSMLTRFFAF